MTVLAAEDEGTIPSIGKQRHIPTLFNYPSLLATPSVQFIFLYHK